MRQRSAVRPTRVEQTAVALIALAVIISVVWLLNQEITGGFPSG